MFLRGRSFFLISSIFTVATGFFRHPKFTASSIRDREPGYWFDAIMVYNREGTSSGLAVKTELSCNVKLFKRSLKPVSVNVYTSDFMDSLHHTWPALPGDNTSTEIRTIGDSYYATPFKVRPGDEVTCELELGDGTKVRREVTATSLDESPFVYIESSQYPENDTIMYGQSFYIIPAFFGKDVNTDIEFAYCDPKTSECKAEADLQNYEQLPRRGVSDVFLNYYLTGHAAESGHYIFTAMTDKGNASVHYHLKVADPIPGSWTEETSSVDEDVIIHVEEGQNFTIPCTFTSPVPYKNNVLWYQDGRRIWSTNYIRPTADGSYLQNKNPTFMDSGIYNCTIEFIDWSKKVPSMTRSVTVKVKNDSTSVLLGSCTRTMMLVFLVNIMENIY